MSFTPSTAERIPWCKCETAPPSACSCRNSKPSPIAQQRGRFSEFRRALLYHMSSQQGGLAAWDGDQNDDLGVMLAEGWAYILDSLSFYDSEIARNAYLSTTSRQSIAEALTQQLGYTPRPATASKALIALQAIGDAPVDLPIGTAFRSAGGPEGDPQVFETRRSQTIDPALNRLTFAPSFDSAVGSEIWVDAGSHSLVEGQWVLISYPQRDPSTASGGPSSATSASASSQLELRQLTTSDDMIHVLCMIEALYPFQAETGQRYVRVGIKGGLPVDLIGADYRSVTIKAFSQFIRPSTFYRSGNTDTLALEAVYTALKPDQIVAIEGPNGSLSLDRIAFVGLDHVKLQDSADAPTVPVTEVRFGQTGTGLDLIETLHVQPVTVAYPSPPPNNEISVSSLVNQMPLINQDARLSHFDGTQTDALIKGTGSHSLKARLAIATNTATRSASARITDNAPGSSAFQTPVSAFANLVEVTRGQSVRGEILGQSDGRTPFQRFELQSAPLTYVASENSDGVVPILIVRVNGILWDRVETFLGISDREQVYRVITDYDDRSFVEFGDRAIPASGASIVADYRFGAGSARPPTGAIQSIIDRPAGLETVLWSVEAEGGSERESKEDIRKNGPASILSLGRAVSISDYTAFANRYDGVAVAKIAWTREIGLQRPAVKAWIVPNGPDISQGLRTHLRNLGDPEVQVDVALARPEDVDLTLTVKADQRFRPEDVEARLRRSLFDETTGKLIPRVLGIGRNLFRSELVHWAMAVRGVDAVETLILGDGSELAGIICPHDHYLRFVNPKVEVIA